MNFRKLQYRSRIQSWCEHGPSDAAGWVLLWWLCELIEAGSAYFEAENTLMLSGGWTERQLSVWVGITLDFVTWQRVFVNLWPAVLSLEAWKSWVESSCRSPIAGQLGWERGGREGAGDGGGEPSSCQHVFDSLQPQATSSTVSPMWLGLWNLRDSWFHPRMYRRLG